MRRVRSARKKTHRAKLGFVALVLVILITLYPLIILSRPLKPIYAASLPGPVSNNTKLAVDWPSASPGSQAAVGIDGYGLIGSSGAQTPTPTASIAKIVTALSILRKYPLAAGQPGPTITLTTADVNDYNNYVAEDGSVIKVVAGEQLSEYQALQAMLLPSADNMADTLANWGFGSTTAYAAYANQLVKSLGMDSTTISDASGFSPSTVSTADDLIILGQAALASPVITQIVGESSAVLPAAGTVSNVDRLLGQDNIIGIKTGNTDQAGGCFLSAAKYNLGEGHSVTVIGVVLKRVTLQAALDSTLPMLASVRNQLALKTTVAGTPTGSYTTPWGDKADAVTKTSLTTEYLPGIVSYANTANGLTPPVDAGTTSGSLEVGISGDKDISPVVLSQPITAPSLSWRLFHPGYFF